MAEILVSRQPIYDRDLEVYAYELMAAEADGPAVDADKATSQVIINAFMEIGIDKLVHDRIAFIKVAERFLSDDDVFPLPQERVILKIPSYLNIDAQLIAGVERLVAAGYRLAIDNYLEYSHLQPLAYMASIIDLNIEKMSRPAIQANVGILKKLHPVVLVDHVQSHDEYDFCRDLGVEYFQGYFLSRPRIVRGESLGSNQMSIMNLLTILHSPDTTTDTIESVIARDVSLSYKILQLINSAFFNRPSKIESIRHAVVMLGRKQLTTWASLMALASMDEKPQEQVRNAMIRAKACELLASLCKLDSPDSFFTVGMFSALDLLMDRRLEELIEPLPLADNIVLALLNRDGDMGAALNCVLAQETGDWVNIRFRDLSVNDLTQVNIEAMNWADGISKAV